MEKRMKLSERLDDLAEAFVGTDAVVSGAYRHAAELARKYEGDREMPEVFTRVDVIDVTGLVHTWGWPRRDSTAEACVQDGGRTLKLFVKGKW
jgi:hypothetical protein